MLRRFEVIEDDCVGCTLCSVLAPDNLEISSGTDKARVFKQPETSQEEAACAEASGYCPTGGLKMRTTTAGDPAPGVPNPTPAEG